MRSEPGVLNAVDGFVNLAPIAKVGLPGADMRLISSDYLHLVSSLHPFPRQVIRAIFHAVSRRACVMVNVKNAHCLKTYR
jgi:hypothetical protein